MFIQKENFIIKCEPNDEAHMDQVDFGEIYARICKFFDFNKKLSIKIYVIYSINEYNFLSNMKFEGWNCAFCGSNNMIYIFSPNLMGEILNRSKADLASIVAHELSHIIYGNKGFKQIPLINEGIATYLSFYDRHKNDLNEELASVNLFKFSQASYSNGVKLIHKIVTKFGKEKLFSFLTAANNLSEDEINKNFALEFNIN